MLELHGLFVSSAAPIKLLEHFHCSLLTQVVLLLRVFWWHIGAFSRGVKGSPYLLLV